MLNNRKKRSRYQKGDLGHLDTTKKTSRYQKKMHPPQLMSETRESIPKGECRPYEGCLLLGRITEYARSSLVRSGQRYLAKFFSWTLFSRSPWGVLTPLQIIRAPLDWGEPNEEYSSVPWPSRRWHTCLPKPTLFFQNQVSMRHQYVSCL